MSKEQKKGFFIALEGIDGCGKTVMSRRLAAALAAQGWPVLLTREPGDGPLGPALREILLHGQGVTATTEALLFAADRAQHVAHVLRPALAAGQVVVCDRYTDSTLAYQGGGRQLPMAALEQLNDFASGGLRPDLILYLRVSWEQALARRGEQEDRMEENGRAFFARVEAVYQRRQTAMGAAWRTIDANLPEEQVWEQVWQSALAALKRRQEGSEG